MWLLWPQRTVWAWPKTMRLSMAINALFFLAVGLFLAVNGYGLQATQPDATLTMLSVASGAIDEATFAEWIRQHSQLR